MDIILATAYLATVANIEIDMPIGNPEDMQARIDDAFALGQQLLNTAE